MPTKKPTSRKHTSRKQRAANRRNAQKSTGPRTAAGKQIVSMNNLRHGLRGKFGVLPEEDAAVHAAYTTQYVLDLAPATPREYQLAQAIANDQWRLDRARALENNMIAVGHLESDYDPDQDPDLQMALTSARTFMNNTDKFLLLSLYEQRLYCAIRRNRAELKQIQSARAQANSFCPNELQAEIAQNGFGRANNSFESRTA